jgi:hypothetical protein
MVALITSEPWAVVAECRWGFLFSPALSSCASCPQNKASYRVCRLVALPKKPATSSRAAAMVNGNLLSIALPTQLVDSTIGNPSNGSSLTDNSGSRVLLIYIFHRLLRGHWAPTPGTPLGGAGRCWLVRTRSTRRSGGCRQHMPVTCTQGAALATNRSAARAGPLATLPVYWSCRPARLACALAPTPGSILVAWSSSAATATPQLVGRSPALPALPAPSSSSATPTPTLAGGPAPRHGRALPASISREFGRSVRSRHREAKRAKRETKRRAVVVVRPARTGSRAVDSRQT